jgi:hypothetical protein
MADEIIAALDETGATTLMQQAQSALGTLADSGSGSLGPFTASWGASASFSGGNVDLIPPDIIRIATMQMNYQLSFSFQVNLNDFLPTFCLPRVCIRIPFNGRICTPRICISWPTVSIPLTYSDALTFSGDFKLSVYQSGPDWKVDVVIVGVPFLQISPAAAAILAALSLAVAAVLAPIPFIGPFLAVAALVIINTIGIAGVLGLLGAILTPFVSGLRFNVYTQAKLFNVLPAGGPVDPAANITLDLVEAEVVGSDEDELVFSANISPA